MSEPIAEIHDLEGVAKITVEPGLATWRCTGFGKSSQQAKIAALGIAASKLHREDPIYELHTMAAAGQVRVELGYRANGSERGC